MKVSEVSSLGQYKPKAAQPITRKWNVPSSRNLRLFTCGVRLGAKSYAKMNSNFQNSAGFLSTAVNFFQGFTLIKFKSTLKHTQIFFKSAFKNYFFIANELNGLLFSLLSSLTDVAVLLKGYTWSKPFTIYVSLQCLERRFRQTGFKFFLPLSQFIAV